MNDQLETRVAPGEIVPNGFSFPNNAEVQGDFLYVRDAKGNIIPDRKVSVGDKITVLRVIKEANLALVQYPVGDKLVREGYVTNATNIIKYKNQDQWVNKNSRTTVYTVANTESTELGYLDPNERATFLFRQNNMDNVVYNSSGIRNKSGFVTFNGSGTGGGSGSGTSGENPWPDITPGHLVPGGFTFPNNAKLVGGSLQLKDSNGNNVQGTVSNGDSITVLDVGYTRQLALVQYPVSGGVKQGYIQNNTNIIKYNNPYNWTNGASSEPVYQSPISNNGKFGTLNPYESATKLYKVGNRYHVVYDTDKGVLSKSGYVEYEGKSFGDTSITIPTISYSGVTYESYGSSGKGRPLHLYKIGNGSKILFAGFAIHGWEDNWSNDGLALVKIANELVKKIGAKNNSDGLNGWTVYIASCMNPDGVIVNGTNNGPGRCAVTTGIDLNRCFPAGFTVLTTPRNRTGNTPLGAPEAVALKNLIERLHSQASKLVVIDGHGWLNCTYGNSTIASYFTKEFGFSYKGTSGGGFFSRWVETLPKASSILLEYPTSTYSYSDVERGDYVGKTYRAMMNIIGASTDSGNGGGSNSGNGSGSNSGNGNIIVGSKVKITGTHWATGQLIPDWAKNETYTVSEINGDRALLQEVISWIYLKDVVLVSGGGSSDSGNGGGSNSGNGGGSNSGSGNIIVGSKVKIIGTHWATGQLIPNWAKNETYTVSEIDGDRALLQEVISWIYLKDIVLVSGGGSSDSGNGGGSNSENGGGSNSGNGNIIVGSKVKITGTHWATGQLMPDWAKNETYTVSKIDGDRALLQEVISWIYLKDIVLVSGGGNSDSGIKPKEELSLFAAGIVKMTKNKSVVNVTDKASESGAIVGQLKDGQTVEITAINNGWFKIETPIRGYVRTDYIKIAHNAISPFHDQVRYIYAIVDRTTLGDCAAKYSKLAEENSNLQDMLFTTPATIATYLGVIPKLANFVGTIGYIGAAITTIGIIVKGALSCNKRLADVYRDQILKYGGAPEVESEKYNVIRIPIVFVDPHYDRYNPKPATDGQWRLSYANAKFVYGLSSYQKCVDFINSEDYTVWV